MTQLFITFVMTVWPSCEATKSFTLLAGAFSSLLPPMKWSASLYLAAYDVEPLVIGTVPLAWDLPVPLTAAIVYYEEVVKLESSEQEPGTMPEELWYYKKRM